MSAANLAAMNEAWTKVETEALRLKRTKLLVFHIPSFILIKLCDPRWQLTT